jgi:hypothetical protein
MNIRRKLAIAGISLLSVVGIGAGVSAAQSSPSSTVAPAAVSTPAPDTTTPDATPEATTPESTTGAEAPGAPEPAGEASLPGGGHADPAGSNVDHQFEGVE